MEHRSVWITGKDVSEGCCWKDVGVYHPGVAAASRRLAQRQNVEY